jgi:hypothetical protein
MAQVCKLYLAFGLFVLFGLASACKKDPPPPPEPTGPPKIFLTDQILDYIYQPEGTVMIYEDTLTGVLDTVTVLLSQKDTTTWVLAQDPDLILYYEEALAMEWQHSFSKVIAKFHTQACVPHENTFCITLHRRGANFGRAGITQFPWVVGNINLINTSSGSHSTIHAFYPTIMIGGIQFEKVYLLKITRDTSEELQDIDYYFARHIGVVAKIEYGTNRQWVLKTKIIL